MGILTPFFNLFKPAKSDPAAIERINGNMDVIDLEMHRPPLTVNGIQPNPVSRDLEVTTVPLADNLTSDEAQINTGTYIIRSSGGEASIKDGSAMLSEIRGNMVKTGAVAQSVVMNVSGEDIQDTEIDENAFIAAVTPASGTMVFSYTDAWNVNPELYGITVTGTPASGDSITVVYTKESRGTITVAHPVTFISTGWNLYDNVTGYARVCRYSEEYDFKISGEYTSIAFADTPAGAQTPISPVDGHFSLPAGKDRGYIIVTGGNATDTAIWMAWGDWTEQANGGVFEPYTQTQIDLSEVMTLFPYGIMKVGNVSDEINLNTGRAYGRIERLAYTAENLENVIASGVDYDTDTGYIYAVREFPASFPIDLDGEYTVSDHGTEIFSGTTVAVIASSLYGDDLKGKLRRDVLTISQQTLTDQQKAQVLQNIGAASAQTAEALAQFGAVKYIPCVATSTDSRLISAEVNCFRTGNVVSMQISSRWNFSGTNFEEGETVTMTISGHPAPVMALARNVSMHSARIMVVTLAASEVSIREVKGTNTSSNAPIGTNIVYITNDP